MTPYVTQPSHARTSLARIAQTKRLLHGRAVCLSAGVPPHGPRGRDTRRRQPMVAAAARARLAQSYAVDISHTRASSEEQRSALPTVGTWSAIEAGHRDSLLYRTPGGGKNRPPRDETPPRRKHQSAHHHTHHSEADRAHTRASKTQPHSTRSQHHTPRYLFTTTQ